jgi:hypothetical protein
MKSGESVELSIVKALERRNLITIIMDSGSEQYQGLVDKIYENRIFRFVMKARGTSCLAGYILMADVKQVIPG